MLAWCNCLKRRPVLFACLKNINLTVAGVTYRQGPSEVSQVVVQTRPKMNSHFKKLPDPIKSANDKRLYRAIELDNGLKVLLISDTGPLENTNEAVDDCKSESNSVLDEGVDIEDSEGSDEEEEQHNEQKEKMAAAALSVKVGNFSDPEDLQGLAHYLEHMLFMGSEKYPNENEYDEFITKHGGSDNAHTENEFTNYEFEVNTKNFKNALDMFAQFFIAPLMKKSSLDRELEAVDSEFRLAYPSDAWRKSQLISGFCKKGNPIGFFSLGNKDSLKSIPESKGIDVYSKIREFWDHHYSSHLMTLCVISRESLDTLQDWVIEIFSKIQKKDVSEPTFEGHSEPFATPEFYKLCRVSPIKKIQELVITWSLPSLVKHYKVKPLGYIGWLVGHEGRGSILELLRKRVWAIGLTGGNDESNLEHNKLTSMFGITVTMTDSGFENLEDIFLVIFQYLDMLKKNGPQKRIYDELQSLDEMNFRWKDEGEPTEYVSSLCGNMQIYEPEDVLRGDQLMLQYDEKLIKECMDALRPDNCNIMILSSHYQKDNPCDKIEKWMQIPYSQENVPQEWIELWKNPPPNPDLYLPEPNRFIATDFDIKVVESSKVKEFPLKLKESDLLRLWYKKDTKFNVPKGYIYVNLKSPLCKCSPQNAVLLDMFIYQLQLNLSPEAYSAKMASLDYEIYREDPGLQIKINGFNHKLPVLLSTILDYILNFDLTEEMFEGMRVQFLKSYYNQFIKPKQLCQSLRLSIIQQHYWTHIEKRIMLEKITLQSLKSFWKQLVSHLFVEIMVHGNFTPKEALEIGQMVQDKLQFTSLLPEMIPELRTMEVPQGERILRVMSFNKDDTNSSVTNYYQLGPGTIYLSCLNDLLLSIMHEPCFDILRTKEQLGYHVGCASRSTYGILGFVIMVNSPADKFSCSHLDSRIENFLDEFKKKISDMTEEEFETRVSSLVKNKNCSDLYMGAEASRNWGEIVSSCCVFNRIKRETDCLQKIQIDEFKKWAENVLNKETTKKLGIQVVGQGDKALGECVPSEDNCSVNQDDIYALQYLHCKQSKHDIFIDEIASFKRTMSVYPVCRIVK